jgi:phosphoribosylanthranilate isomerase
VVRVKICGVTNLADAQAAEKYGASALGFVFYKRSPRYISPEKAKNIIVKLSPFIKATGVFVNEKESKVKKIADFCSLNILQFHGDESAGYCAKFKQAEFKQYKTIKAFRIKDKNSFRNIKNYNTDAVLLDAFSKDEFGGTGKTFDWVKLKKLKLNRPVILSGGLNVKNVRRAIASTRVSMVDVSSGVEKTPAKKDHRLIKEFISKAQNI